MATENPLSIARESIVLPTRSTSTLSGARDRLYVAMGSTLLAIILIAFSTRYFVRPSDAPPLAVFVHAHALLFIGWVVLFVVQATLAQRQSFRFHRQVGLGGVGLATIIVIVGMYSAIAGARRGHNPGGFPNALAFMIVGLTDIALFASFVGLAWYFRKRHELHKRLMLFATLGGFLWPAITRLPFLPVGPQRGIYMFAILLIVLLIPAVTNRIVQRRTHWLDWAGAAVIFASLPLRRFVGLTETWQQVAAWTVGV